MIFQMLLCTGENLGYGWETIMVCYKNNYALILNPDLICDENFFSNLEKMQNQNDFSIIGCQYLHDKIFMPAFFNQKKIKNLLKNLK